MAQLVILSGPEEGRIFTLGETCVIGRQDDCDLCISNDAVSRRHAHITLEEDGYYIEDLGSSNGTFVNGDEIQRVKLADGDTIKLSHSVLAFREHPRERQTQVTVVNDLKHPDSTVIRPQDAVSALIRDTTTVENLDQLQDLHEKLLTVARFSKEVRSTLDLKTLLGKVLGLLFEIFPQAERGFVMLHDDQGQLRPVASRNVLSDGEITISSTVLGVAIGEKKAILSNNPVEDSRFGAGESIVTHGMRSLMVSPLISGDEVIGVMHIDTTRPSAPFSTDDLALFTGLGDQASVAVSNARLHERLMHRQKLEQELILAHTVQRSFLPTHVPENDRVDLAFHYALARQVGGDFYDLVELPGGILGVAIGDVSGKGIPAALLMAKTISEMRVATHAEKSPSSVLSMVNSMMLGSISPDMFVTALVCFIDPATGQAAIADAGHNSPILRRSSGEVAFLDLTKGFPLGVVDQGQYGDQKVMLEPGDTLLFYTDGLTDATSAAGELFGNERLRESASKADPGAHNIIDSVLGSVRDFIGAARPFDDLTMIAISLR